jgi:hypothetical protein
MVPLTTLARHPLRGEERRRHGAPPTSRCCARGTNQVGLIPPRPDQRCRLPVK